MKVRNKCDVSEDAQFVYAILEQHTLSRIRRAFLLKASSDHLMWFEEKDYEVVDFQLPTGWVCKFYERNVVIHPSDRLSGNGSVFFSGYMGPSLLINPIENLIMISNVDRSLSDLIISMYTLE